MLKNRALLLITLVTVLVIFCYGVTQLLVLRFRSGDVYAPYSSLRSDPLGTRALFDSLARLDGFSVRRNYEVPSELSSGDDTTILYLGVSARSWEYVSKDSLKPFENFATQGGRLVVSFLPVVNPPDEKDRSKKQSSASEKEKPGQKQPSDDNERKNVKPQKSEGRDTDQDPSSSPQKPSQTPSRKKAEDPCKCPSLQELWGLSLGYQPQPLTPSNNTAFNIVETEIDKGLPPVSWHTLLFFKDLDPTWKTIYTLYDQPVIIERSMGRGTVVFAADSFFVSNEALLLDRNPELLAWLIGANSQVVFDEFHLGIMKRSGVAVLIRTYRLHWFFVSIAFLAVLVVWKNATHFVPPYRLATDLNQAPLTSERDHTQGLISLLRRNIPVKEILRVCVAEWKKSVDRGVRIASDKMSQIESLPELQESVPDKGLDPVTGYRKICSILSEGKKL